MIEILEDVFFLGSSNFIFPVKANEATLKFLGTGDQTEFSLRFKSLREKFIRQSAARQCRRRVPDAVRKRQRQDFAHRLARPQQSSGFLVRSSRRRMGDRAARQRDGGIFRR